MTGELYYAAGAAVLCMLYALYQGGGLLMSRDAAHIEATVIELRYADRREGAGERSRGWRNSKWARMAYRIQGKRYVSRQWIQVPLYAEVGSKICVKVRTGRPDRILNFSVKRFGGSLAAAALFFLFLGFGQ